MFTLGRGILRSLVSIWYSSCWCLISLDLAWTT